VSGGRSVVPHDVESTLRMVREARTRTLTCEVCNVEFETYRLTGRPMSKCEGCDPQGPGWIRDRTERHMRATIAYLDAKVSARDQVIDALSGGSGMGRRAHRFGAPSVDALKRAIRAVANARGASGTADALLTLAAVAQGWAAVLTSTVDVEDERAA
jgi:hypothetical protein